MQSYRRMIWAVHQLDKDTSGLNLFVRRKALVKHWTEQMQAGTKTYLAVVDGSCDWDHLDIKEPVGFIPSAKVRGVTKDGKKAYSEAHVLDRGKSSSLVRVTLHTGRTHQIRIHLAHVGHPLVGDQWYGDPNDNRIHRHALHAWRIDTPAGDFWAPIPSDMRDLLQRQGLEIPAD